MLKISGASVNSDHYARTAEKMIEFILGAPTSLQSHPGVFVNTSSCLSLEEKFLEWV
jgi:hypothetical protein